MTKYFSTFIPGMGEIVKTQLSKDLSDFFLVRIYDGLIIYQSNSPAQKVNGVKYLNNSFLFLAEFKNLPNKEPLIFMSKEILKEKLSGIPLFGKTFRIMFYTENKPASISKNILGKLENKIAVLNKIRVDRTSPAEEFWILYRKEGFGLFGLKLTKHADYKKTLVRGQLHPELANLLSLISQPGESDIVLDPFAGSGAILAERMSFPSKEIISGDIQPKKKHIRKMDALNMTNIKSGSIDKIITDPPWGISVGRKLDLPAFYLKMLVEFKRVLKQGGFAVILTGNKEVFEAALNNLPNLKLLYKYDILVSGKKAAIYKLIKE